MRLPSTTISIPPGEPVPSRPETVIVFPPTAAAPRLIELYLRDEDGDAALVTLTQQRARLVAAALQRHAAAIDWKDEDQ